MKSGVGTLSGDLTDGSSVNLGRDVGEKLRSLLADDG